MEKRIEVEILKETLRKTSDRSIRTELIDAYILRLNRLNLYKEEEPLAIPKKVMPPMRGKQEVPDPTITKPLNEHSTYDIGYYCEFLNEDMGSLFTHECFGVYKDMEYFGTNKFGVMIREESIAITNALKRLQDARPVHWEALRQMG